MSQIRLFFELPLAEVMTIAPLMEALFEDDGFPVSSFETSETDAIWTLSVYCDHAQREQATARMETALRAQGLEPPIRVEDLPDINWIEKTLEDLAPVRAGRYVVHGSHDAGCAAPHEYAIRIDAGMAFGTGHHGTTAGCLAMIDRELKRKRPFNALDLGAGTGVLAIAVAKAMRIPVLATDIDPVAVAICRQNARLNGVGEYVEAITATGFNHTRLAANAPFDLIVANILAGPLQAMASQLARHLAPRGSVILSGLLPHQKARILAAYRAQGMALDHAHYQHGWMTLVLKKMS